jgi:capsular polysaccharide transport system permease protein
MNALMKLRDLSRIIVRQPTALTRKAADLYFEETRRRATTIRMLFVGLVVLPTACAALYYGLWAAPRYVSEAQFVVTKAASARPTGLDALLKTFGTSRQVDDTSIVTGYLLSRDAVRSIENELPLREIFSRTQADLFSRFPRFWRGDTFERLYDYFLDRIAVFQDPRTGLSVLTVQTFRPEDSQALANVLLRLAEKAVNDLNRRAETDTLNFAWGEVDRAQQKLIDAQQALTSFRTQELLVDPSRTSAAVLETITRLSRDRVQVLAQKQQILTSAPESPAGQALSVRADALQRQIDQERAKLAGGAGSLAPTVSSYERLTLLRELAEKDVAAAQGAMESARQEAQRQHLYIQMPIAPNLSDESTEPQRWRAIATVFVTGFAIFAFVWILMVGASEHSHQ